MKRKVTRKSRHKHTNQNHACACNRYSRKARDSQIKPGWWLTLKEEWEGGGGWERVAPGPVAPVTGTQVWLRYFYLTHMFLLFIW